MAKKKQKKPQKKKSRADAAGGLVFVGCLFIGTGLGIYYGRPDVGSLLGLGVGFLAYGVMRSKMKD